MTQRGNRGFGLRRAVLAAAVMASGSVMSFTVGQTAGTAGASTAGYTMTCNGTGAWTSLKTIDIAGTVTTGSLPASVTAGGSFSLGGYGMTFALPKTGIFGDAAGLTIAGTYTTSVAAVGATPSTQATTLAIPRTTIPETIPAGGVPITATASAPGFVAGPTPATITVSTGTGGTLAITVTGIGTVTLACTNPASVIATVTAAAPKTRVTSVLPNAGPLAGGTSTTITGAGFSGASAVTFGGEPAVSFAVVSGTTIVAVVPAHPAGTVNVTVTSPQGTSTLSTADHFTYTNGPIVTGVSPADGAPTGGTAVTIEGLQLGGAETVAFGQTAARTVVVTTTEITAVSPPHTSGVVDVTATGPRGTSVLSVQDHFTFGLPGYWTVAADGGVFSYGTLGFYGSMGGKPLDAPIVGMAGAPTGNGYWLVASDGGIFAFGSARFYGSMGGQPLRAPVVAMAAAPTGGGYWLVASDGGVFAFGSAQFYGSIAAGDVPSPVVSLVASPSGDGYWEVGATGAIYSFGTPGLFGSMGGRALDQPIVDAASTPDFYGDWEVASDGGIFSFGDATFDGSMGGRPLTKPVVAMAAAPGGQGYWEVASDGGIFSFGDASFYGSMGGEPLDAPMVGIAVV